ncbi:hypothetical protein V8C86DRAFT_510731 [Haematococcus lacustris]
MTPVRMTPQQQPGSPAPGSMTLAAAPAPTLTTPTDPVAVAGPPEPTAQKPDSAHSKAHSEAELAPTLTPVAPADALSWSAPQPPASTQQQRPAWPDQPQTPLEPEHGQQWEHQAQPHVMSAGQPDQQWASQALDNDDEGAGEEAPPQHPDYGYPALLPVYGVAQHDDTAAEDAREDLSSGHVVHPSPRPPSEASLQPPSQRNPATPNPPSPQALPTALALEQQQYPLSQPLQQSTPHDLPQQQANHQAATPASPHPPPNHPPANYQPPNHRPAEHQPLNYPPNQPSDTLTHHPAARPHTLGSREAQYPATASNQQAVDVAAAARALAEGMVAEERAAHDTAMRMEAKAREELEDMCLRIEKHFKAEQAARQKAEELLQASITAELDATAALEELQKKRSAEQRLVEEERAAIKRERGALEMMRQEFETELQAARAEVAKAQEVLAGSEERIRAAEQLERARLEGEFQAKLLTQQAELERMREEMAYRSMLMSEEMEKWRQQAALTANAVTEAKNEEPWLPPSVAKHGNMGRSRHPQVLDLIYQPQDTLCDTLSAAWALRLRVPTPCAMLAKLVLVVVVVVPGSWQLVGTPCCLTPQRSG